MRYMTGREIRDSFLKYFESKEHKILPSASLIPNDPQLMFTVAGMVPFKPIFWGKVAAPHKRVATCQKCVRTNDIENVGRTPRHQTFFEMLGNFSFGDYFKREAIEFAWEYVTEVLKIPEEKLWVSIYKDDDEAFEMWKNGIGISEKKIVRLGKEDNWWGPVGPSGPCGPDSEIFIDRGPQKDCPDPRNCDPSCDCGRFLEFWNLVFTGLNQDENGIVTELASKNIDTGLGLERLTAIMQGVESNFDTDLFQPIIRTSEELLGVKYGEHKNVDVSLKVIADHARAVSFMIADGILPSNEGRGYVLRRVLRRAVRHGSLLGSQQPFLYKILDTVSVEYGDIYSEIRNKLSLIQKITLAEEERFLSTLESGTKRLWNIIESKKKLDGEDLFLLHDTFGFPFEIVEEIVSDKNIELDKVGFEKLMEEQKKRARKATGEKEYLESNAVYEQLFEKAGNTEFLGYESLITTSTVLGIVKDGELAEALTVGQEGEVIFDKTPFYAEKGGQVADVGKILFEEGTAEVEAVFVGTGEMIVHRIKIIEGTLYTGREVEMSVMSSMRKATARNHTATHLLHEALREILGSHVKQAGSFVEPDRLRFDFSHYTSLTDSQRKEVEEIVNEKIMENIPVDTVEKSLDETRSENIIALFEEKYGDKVRVVSIGDFSKELCGGTHVRSTGEIGLFKIISETSVSAGVRRIEAVSGFGTYRLLESSINSLDEIKTVLDVPQNQILPRLGKLLQDIKEKDKNIKSLQEKLLSGQGTSDDVEKEINGVKIFIRVVENAPVDVLRNTTDVLSHKIGGGIVIIFDKLEGKAVFVVKVDKGLTKDYRAGDIARKIAKELGGGGGGRPEFAQAGGKELEKIGRIIDSIDKYI